MKTLNIIITALCLILSVAALNSCADYPEEAFFMAEMNIKADYDNAIPNEDGTYNLPILCSIDIDRASEEIETAYIEYRGQGGYIRVDVTDIVTSKSRMGSVVLENLIYNSKYELEYKIETSSFSNMKKIEICTYPDNICKVKSVEAVDISPCGATIKGTTNIRGEKFTIYNISASDDPNFKNNVKNFHTTVNKDGEFSLTVGMFDQKTKVYYRVGDIQNSFTTSENLADISVSFSHRTAGSWPYYKVYQINGTVSNDRSGLTDSPKFEIWDKGQNKLNESFNANEFRYEMYDNDRFHYYQVVYYRGNTPVAILDNVYYSE